MMDPIAEADAKFFEDWLYEDWERSYRNKEAKYGPGVGPHRRFWSAEQVRSIAQLHNNIGKLVQFFHLGEPTTCARIIMVTEDKLYTDAGWDTKEHGGRHLGDCGVISYGPPGNRWNQWNHLEVIR